MPACTQHPGRESVAAILGKEYCAACRDGIAAARSLVDGHVEPKECFIWYVSNDNWQPITGTGCAHWVAHQRHIQTGLMQEHCLAGYTFRVPTLIVGKTKVTDLKRVRVNDIYVSPAVDHTGLVIRVRSASDACSRPSITIRHDSSGQHQVAENDFATYFHGHGAFYR